MQGQGRKGASGRGDGLGVRRSRSVPEKPSASLGGAAQGVRRVSLLNNGVNCGMVIMTRGTKQKQSDILVIQRCAAGCRRCKNHGGGQLSGLFLFWPCGS